jgi:rRNA maturation endonuclease Nob1
MMALAVGSLLFWPTWLFVQVIMGIDMAVLWNKRTALRETRETKQCPACAESVKAAAKLCRFCGHQFANTAE